MLVVRMNKEKDVADVFLLKQDIIWHLQRPLWLSGKIEKVLDICL